MHGICMLFRDIMFSLFKSIVNTLTAYFSMFRTYNLNQEIILITGSSKGIGKQIALYLTKFKPRMIILWGRDMDGLQKTATDIQEFDVECVAMKCDVTKPEDINQQAQRVKEMVGRVTLVINNAGVVSGHNICDLSSEDIETTIKTNTYALMWITKCFLPDMIEAQHGHIVCINSILGLMGLAGVTDYCASKHAGTAFLETLASETSQSSQKVYFTSVHPFMVNTDMFKGCKTRFPWLFPSLDQKYVAKRTVEAILRKERAVILPKLMSLVLLCKSVLPVPAMLEIQRFFEVDTVMHKFQGRRGT